MKQPSLPAELASVSPDTDTRPFWEACGRRELRFQRCLACGRFRHPPLARCPDCGSAASDWPQVSGHGSVYTYTIIHHAVLPALAASLPYAVVLVAFEDAPGVHLISNLIDAHAEDVTVGLPVELVWSESPSGLPLPLFRPAD